MTKIWYKNNDPTKIISTGKSVGNPDESYFESDILPDDDELYIIDHSGPGPVLARKSQAEIDAIFAARAQAAAAAAQEASDALGQMSFNDLINLTYAQVDTYIDNNVTDLASAKTVLKCYGKIILAILKYLKRVR
jgi:hypothetical protein